MAVNAGELWLRIISWGTYGVPRRPVVCSNPPSDVLSIGDCYVGSGVVDGLVVELEETVVVRRTDGIRVTSRLLGHDEHSGFNRPVVLCKEWAVKLTPYCIFYSNWSGSGNRLSLDRGEASFDSCLRLDLTFKTLDLLILVGLRFF